MENRLSELVMKLWPKPNSVQVSIFNKWFGTLLRYARDEGLNPFSENSYFEIVLDYDSLYFENADGSWNALFKIRDRVMCFLVDNSKKKRIQLKNVHPSFVEFLVIVSNLDREVMFGIPPVGIVDTPQKTGLGAEKTIPIWKFV